MDILNRTTAKVNRVIELIETNNITQTKESYQSCRCLGSRSIRSQKVWRREEERSMVEKTYWRKYKAAVKGYQYSGKGKKRQTAKMVEEKYRVKRKGLTTVIKELKQRILAEAAKISWYEQRIQQYGIERLFKLNQKKVYNRFNGQAGSSNRDIPEESRSF